MKRFCWAMIPLAFLPAFAASIGTITNNPSGTPITLDGAFTTPQEWSTVTPAAFIASGNTATPTTVNNALANSYLYAVEAQGSVGPNGEVYVLLDNFTRTNTFSSNGASVADVGFPIFIGGIATNVTLHITTGPSQTFVLSLTQDSNQANLNSFLTSNQVAAAVGFGIDPFLTNSAKHEIIEVEVALAIASNGTWRVSASDNTVDPPISSAIFTLNPDNSITLQPIVLTATPEPASYATLGLGLVGLAFVRRRSRARVQ